MAAWTNWLSKHCRSCGNLLPLRVTQLLITALCPQTFNLEKIDVTWKEMWNDSIHSKWFSKHHIGRNQGFKDRVCQFSVSYFEILMTSVLRCCNNMNHSPRKKHDWTLHWSVTDWPANQQTHRFWTQTQWSYKSRMCVCVCFWGVAPSTPPHTHAKAWTHTCMHSCPGMHTHTHGCVHHAAGWNLRPESAETHTSVEQILEELITETRLGVESPVHHLSSFTHHPLQLLLWIITVLLSLQFSRNSLK